MTDDPLSGCRGLAFGCVLGAAVWFAVGVIWAGALVMAR